MARVLLVGGSASALPFAQAIMEHGHDIVLLGNRLHEPVREAARWIVDADYSDFVSTQQALRDVTFDFIVPSANDAAYNLASHLADLRGLPGYDPPYTGRLLTDKSQFRTLCDSLGIPSPIAHKEAQALDELAAGKPLIVKPVDANSGKGISVVTDARVLQHAMTVARKASSAGSCVIEDFLQGSLHSHSMFWLDGEVHCDFFVDEYCGDGAFHVTSSNSPSRLSTQIQQCVREYVTRIGNELNLVNGLLHTQFMNTKAGPMLIECMRRSPGDLFPTLVERSSGFDYSNSYVASFLGVESTNRSSLRSIPWARHSVISSSEVAPWGVELEGEYATWYFVPMASSGERIQAAPEGKFGIMFIRFDSNESLWAQTPSAASRLILRVGRHVSN